jgi:hypothetical protein
MQLVKVLSNILVVDRADDATMLDDIIAVGGNRKPTFPGFAACGVSFRLTGAPSQ